MVHNNYPYKQYIHIAEAFNEGRTEEGNKLFRELNLAVSIVRTAKRELTCTFPKQKRTVTQIREYEKSKV